MAGSVLGRQAVNWIAVFHLFARNGKGGSCCVELPPVSVKNR